MRLTVRVGDRERRVDWQRRTNDSDAASFELDGVKYTVDASRVESGVWSILVDGEAFDVDLDSGGETLLVTLRGRTFRIRPPAPAGRAARSTLSSGDGANGVVTSPMPGKVVRILTEPGARVSAGQGLVIVEAMKMENELRAPREGRVREVKIAPGQPVESGQPLVFIE